MSRLLIGVLGCCWLLMASVGVLAQGADSKSDKRASRAVILRAIDAHGGMKRLGKARADRVKIKGFLYVGKKEVPFLAETTVQLPNQFKNVIEMTINGRLHVIVQVLNGNKAQVTHNGVPQKLEPRTVAEMRQTLRLDRAIRLVPLVTDPTYRLRYLGESKVGRREVVGVEATMQGTNALKLYFDKKTALLIKTVHQVKLGKDKSVEQEQYYSNFKNLQGYKRPTKVAAFRNGKKMMTGELTEVKYYERIPEDEFSRP